MEDSRLNRRLSMGWALFFFWPAAFAPLLFAIPYLSRELDGGSILVITGILIILGCLALLDVAFRTVTRRPHDEPMYPCPCCGADIEHTPHSCPNCGARLLWGHQPGPEDARAFRGRPIEH